MYTVTHTNKHTLLKHSLSPTRSRVPTELLRQNKSALFQPSYFFLSLGVGGAQYRVTVIFCLYTSVHFLFYSLYLFVPVLVQLNMFTNAHTQSTVLSHHMAFWASLFESWVTYAQTCLYPGTDFLKAVCSLFFSCQSAVKCWPLWNRHEHESWASTTKYRTCALIIPRS